MPPNAERIVFLVSSMNAGGAERVAAQLCNHWVGLKHEVMLIATYSGRGELAFEVDKRVKFRYLADEVAGAKDLWNQPHRLLVLRRLIRSERPTRIISFLTNVNVAAIVSTFGLATPVVVSERIYPPAMPLSTFWKFARRLTYPLAHAVVMQTNVGLDWLREHCPGAPGSVIPNPVTLPLRDGPGEIFPNAVLQGSRKVLLAVGRLTQQKQFPTLITAFDKVHRDYVDWDLVILGEGPDRAALESLIQDRALEGRVHLPGRAGNMSAWYNRADAFVLSSSYEGFPNALLEAIAHGLPAVSFDCLTGPRDIIRPGISGILVDPAEGVQGLERAICEMILNFDNYDRAAIQKTATVFNIDHISELWLTV